MFLELCIDWKPMANTCHVPINENFWQGKYTTILAKKPQQKEGGDTVKTNFLPYGKLSKYSFVRIESKIRIAWSTLIKVRSLGNQDFLPEEH